MLRRTIKYTLTILGEIEVAEGANDDAIRSSIAEDYESMERDLGYVNDVEWEEITV